MKNGIIRLAIIFSAFLLSLYIPNQAYSIDQSGFSILTGYKEISIPKSTFSHNTHPDDYFLPNANIPGSAGETTIGPHLNFISLGCRYQAIVSNDWIMNFDLGGLIGLDRDDHQNNNDYRPASNGAFVYSHAKYGTFATTGLSYHSDKFYLGGQAQVDGVRIDNGWDRYSSDESQYSYWKWHISAGPKIGYAIINNSYRLETLVLFGNSTSYSAQLVFLF